MIRMKKDSAIYISILLLCILCVNLLSLDIIPSLLLYATVYILIIKYFKTFHRKWKNLFTSIEFIYLSVFTAYAVFAPIQYLIDDGGQRQWYFYISHSTMAGTFRLYFSIFSILCIILLLFDFPKKNYYEDLFIETKLVKKKNKICHFIFDIGAVLCVTIFLYACIRNGLSFFKLDFGTRRMLAEFSLQQYVWLYMMVYTVVSVSEADIQSKTISFFSKKSGISTFIIVIFWGLSLFVDRRHILSVLIAILIVHLSKMRKLNLRIIILVITAVVLLASYAITRVGLSKTAGAEVLFYTAFSEFILTNYVTCYYFANPVNHLSFGSTYIWDTFTRIFPKAIFPWKPEDLASVFARTVLNGENGYAFNPVAEGLLNFGLASVIVTPIVIFIVIFIGSKTQKKNPLFYALICGYSMDFCRGQFANSIFDIFVMYILLKLMSRLKFERFKY